MTTVDDDLHHHHDHLANANDGLGDAGDQRHRDTGPGNPRGLRVRVTPGAGAGCLFWTRTKTRTHSGSPAGFGIQKMQVGIHLLHCITLVFTPCTLFTVRTNAWRAPLLAEGRL
jgi:hypothetical protein